MTNKLVEDAVEGFGKARSFVLKYNVEFTMALTALAVLGIIF